MDKPPRKNIRRRMGCFLKLIIVMSLTTLVVLMMRQSAARKQEFFAAVQRGDTGSVERMLDRGINVNTTTANFLYHVLLLKDSMFTALLFAVDAGNLEMARLLLDRGADVDKASGVTHHSPLDHSLWYVWELGRMHGFDAPQLKKYRDISHLLLDYDARVVRPNGGYRLSLVYATRTGSIDILNRMLEQDPVFSDASHIIYYSAQYGHTEVIRRLLEYGIPSDNYADGLYGAIAGDQTEIVDILLARDPTLTSNYDAFLIRAAEETAPKAIDFLLNEGVDVDFRDSREKSALMLAAERGITSDIVDALLMHGANVNAVDAKGETALHKAILRGRTKIAVMLLSSGSDPDAADVDGNTPRSLAEERNMTEVLDQM